MLEISLTIDPNLSRDGISFYVYTALGYYISDMYQYHIKHMWSIMYSVGTSHRFSAKKQHSTYATKYLDITLSLTQNITHT